MLGVTYRQYPTPWSVQQSISSVPPHMWGTPGVQRDKAHSIWWRKSLLFKRLITKNNLEDCLWFIQLMLSRGFETIFTLFKAFSMPQGQNARFSMFFKVNRNHVCNSQWLLWDTYNIVMIGGSVPVVEHKASDSVSVWWLVKLTIVVVETHMNNKKQRYVAYEPYAAIISMVNIMVIVNYG